MSGYYAQRGPAASINRLKYRLISGTRRYRCPIGRTWPPMGGHPEQHGRRKWNGVWLYAKRHAIYEARGKKCRPRKRVHGEGIFFIVSLLARTRRRERNRWLPSGIQEEGGSKRGCGGNGRGTVSNGEKIDRGVWQVTGTSVSRKEVKKAWSCDAPRSNIWESFELVNSNGRLNLSRWIWRNLVESSFLTNRKILKNSNVWLQIIRKQIYG